MIKAGGAYTLSITSDHDSNLYVDGALVVNSVGIQSTQAKTTVQSLCVGPHRLWLEYFDKVGTSGMIFQYEGPDSGNQMIVVPPMALQLEASPAAQESVAALTKFGLKEEVFYFVQGPKLQDLNKLRPSLIRLSRTVNYGLSTRGWIGLDRFANFAVRWTGYLVITHPGPYTFSLSSDDGSRLRLGDKLAVDNDGEHGMRTEEGRVDMTSSAHALHLEYYNLHSSAGIMMKYKGEDSDNLMKIVPENVLQQKTEAMVKPELLDGENIRASGHSAVQKLRVPRLETF